MQGYSWRRVSAFPGEGGEPIAINQFRDYNRSMNEKCVSYQFAGNELFLDNAGDRVSLNVINPGTEYWNRIGNKVKLKRLTFRGYLAQGSRSSPFIGNPPGFMYPGYGRIVIFYDHQTNGSTPQWDEVLRNVDRDGNAEVNPSVYSDINWDNKERFLILYDSGFAMLGGVVDLNGTTTSITGGPMPATMDLCWWIDLDLNGLNTIYQSPAVGSTADIMTGGLFIMVLGTEDPDNNNWLLQWRSRVYFEDF